MIINPSLLYGLRQSSLIQCPPSRRAVLGCSDRYGFRSSINDVGSCCCVKKGRSCKEKSCVGVDEIRVRARARRRERDFRCNALGDAEAMLSLLSEEGNKVIRDTRKRSSKVARVLKERNLVVEKCNGSENLERKSKKQQSGFGEVYSKEGGNERRKERESRLVDEERRGESCSSTSSLSESESGESGSVSEVDVKQERFVGEPSTRKGTDSRNTGGIVVSEVNDEVLERYKAEKDHGARVGSSTEWDWRKKSEKKLTDESVEDTRSRKESIMRQSMLSRVNEGSSIMASSSKKQFSDLEEEESALDVSSRRQSRYITRKDDSLSEYMKSSCRHEDSTADLRFHGSSESQVSEHLVSGSQHEQSTSGASEYLKSRRQHYQLSQTNRQNVESTSTTISRPFQGKGATVVGQSVQETECGYCRECGRSVEQRAEQSEISGDARWTTTTHGMLESRNGKQEISTSLSETLVEGVGEWDKVHLAAGQIDVRRNSGQQSETLDCVYGDGQTTLRKQNQLELRIKNLEDKSTSVEVPHDVKISLEGLSGILKESESRKILRTGASASQVSLTSLEIKRHSASDERINDEKTYSTSKLKSAKELVEKDKVVDNTFVQTTLRTELQRPVLQGGLTGKFSGEADTSQPSVGSVSQTGAQQVGEVEVHNDWQLSVIYPPLQLTEINYSDSEPESSFLRKGTGRSTEVDSGYPQHHATRSSSSDRASLSGTGSFEESSLNDTPKSVERMQDSSTQITGEIVEIMRHDSSTSETKIDKELSQADKKHMLTGSTRPLAEETSFLKHDSSHGSKELFDDMYDAKDHSVGEVSESESMEAEISETEGVAAKRAGKSLWNIGAGIFRLPWSATSKTQKSPSKSSQRRSSNASASGETWFSGNEHNEGTADRMKGEEITMSEEPSPSNESLIMRTAFRSRQDDWKKKRSISMPQDPTVELPLLSDSATKTRKKDRRKKEQRDVSQEPSLDKSLQRRTTNKTQKGDFRLMNIIDPLDPVEVNVSSSSSASQGDLVSGSVFTGANTDVNMTQQISVSSQPSPLAASAGRLRRSDALKEIEKLEERISSTSDQRESSPEDVSIHSAQQLTRTDAFEETEEVGRIEEFVSSISETQGHTIDVIESVGTSEEADTELKRGKLRRSKQVISDRFDEWENAYRRENEQRKIDEIFMREALAEAIKAADSWEVPVGAVLVQNGKIVARGYNLVEELRDSTAHAEMICIRDASKVLRTWRLSETTLYVTLEPCPMCAGAILQARIGTLVWGAPNKLLGADGSWIRLFHDGVEGEERSEVAGKPAAPPHPFHTKMNIRRGVLGPECAQVMQKFFQLRRKNEKEKQKRSEEEGQPSCLPVPHKPAKLLRKMHDVFHVK